MCVGREFVVFDMPGTGRVGLSICYDAWYPEVTRHLAADLAYLLWLTRGFRRPTPELATEDQPRRPRPPPTRTSRWAARPGPP
ncbi:nitrilase-related carbon-nitrogen hydrolase [Streptomyces violens]|uniref:nitrilase-related carbon-nitrogen hydrolase n=1 Tax=Streptomyces violens TaxID=66377 RepID=UPI001FE096CB|nr:nitrilase-related carbon-nitrogen hydrolase [Streptomyces violens]